jgi:signal transduction histidine kinase
MNDSTNIKATDTQNALHQCMRDLGHEVNNILGGIKGYAEILQKHVPAVSPLSLWLCEIHDSVDGIFQLTQQISFVSRQDEDDSSPEVRAPLVDLAKVTAEMICARFHPLYEQKTTIMQSIPAELEEKYRRMFGHIFDFFEKLESLGKQFEAIK